jgi:hypothetical protein
MKTLYLDLDVVLMYIYMSSLCCCHLFMLPRVSAPLLASERADLCPLNGLDMMASCHILAGNLAAKF